jgi:murein DD-endopeptidase MepM/ murein hydrolase activator NlpD
LAATSNGLRATEGPNAGGQIRSGARLPLLTNYNDDGSLILTEGKTLLVALTFASPVTDPHGTFPVNIQPTADGEALEEKQPLWFYLSADKKIARTILTAPLDPVPGKTYPLRFDAYGGSDAKGSFNYTIRQGTYRNTVLTLAKEFTSPTPEIDAQKARDFQQMVEVLKIRTPRQWNQPFILPVNRGDNDNFGVKRTVNGTKHYRHRGLDMHAAMRTPVKAVSNGTVALETEQWVAGQTIVIDHGGGVFSKYAHLSERRVRAGDQIVQGQIIALSGNSGGQKAPPHLHLDIIVNGTHVDPKDFMRTAARLLQLETGAQPIRIRA